jgi:hypothetical protein
MFEEKEKKGEVKTYSSLIYFGGQYIAKNSITSLELKEKGAGRRNVFIQINFDDKTFVEEEFAKDKRYSERARKRFNNILVEYGIGGLLQLHGNRKYIVLNKIKTIKFDGARPERIQYPLIWITMTNNTNETTTIEKHEEYDSMYQKALRSEKVDFEKIIEQINSDGKILFDEVLMAYENRPK